MMMNSVVWQIDPNKELDHKLRNRLSSREAFKLPTLEAKQQGLLKNVCEHLQLLQRSKPNSLTLEAKMLADSREEKKFMLNVPGFIPEHEFDDSQETGTLSEQPS